MQGAASKQGETFSMRTSGIPGTPDKTLQVVVRGNRVWTTEGGAWESVPCLRS